MQRVYKQNLGLVVRLRPSSEVVAGLRVRAWCRYLVHMVQLDAAAMNLKRRFEDPNIAASLEAQQAYTRALAPGGDSTYSHARIAVPCNSLALPSRTRGSFAVPLGAKCALAGILHWSSCQGLLLWLVSTRVMGDAGHF